MTMQNLKYEIGQEVIVLDRRGEYECRGKIVGCYACATNLYDVQPCRHESMARRLHAVPQSQLRCVSRQIRAYECVGMRKPPKPVHVLDEA